MSCCDYISRKTLMQDCYWTFEDLYKEAKAKNKQSKENQCQRRTEMFMKGRFLRQSKTCVLYINKHVKTKK